MYNIYIKIGIEPRSDFDYVMRDQIMRSIKHDAQLGHLLEEVKMRLNAAVLNHFPAAKFDLTVSPKGIVRR